MCIVVDVLREELGSVAVGIVNRADIVSRTLLAVTDSVHYNVGYKINTIKTASTCFEKLKLQ